MIHLRLNGPEHTRESNSAAGVSWHVLVVHVAETFEHEKNYLKATSMCKVVPCEGKEMSHA